VISGLITSTLLTLVVVPTLYRLFEGSGDIGLAPSDGEESVVQAH